MLGLHAAMSRGPRRLTSLQPRSRVTRDRARALDIPVELGTQATVQVHRVFIATYFKGVGLSARTEYRVTTWGGVHVATLVHSSFPEGEAQAVPCWRREVCAPATSCNPGVTHF